MKQLTITHKLTNRDNDSLKQYFRDIYGYARFTPDEEAECAFKAAKGDEKALQELINRNLRFVVSVAKQYENKDCLLGDLINEGNFGLIKAAKLFKPDMGFKFISYAVWWIRKFILEYQSNNGRTVRIPINKLNNLAKFNQKVINLEQKLARPVDVQEIMAEYNLTDDDEEIKASRLISTFSIDSLDRDVSADSDGGVTLGELLNNDEYFKPTDHLVNQEDVNSQLYRMLETLKPKEQDIISGLFGLDGKEPLTLDEVGKKYKVTREAIRLARDRILLKLKRVSKKCEQTINIHG